MPKLTSKPPKFTKAGKYAAVYYHGKRHYLGLWGTKEAQIEYARFLAQIRENPNWYSQPENADITVAFLAARFLDHAKKHLEKPNYTHYKIVIGDFLLKLYGDETPADRFKPSCLKLVRSEIIESNRLNRRMVNDYTRRIVSVFSWGVEEEFVQPDTAASLKAVKTLPAGHPGTFEGREREDIPDKIIRKTLPFMPPTVAAMVKLQRLTGCRPSEIFNMRVGEIDRDSDPELFLYRLPHHKTEKKTNQKKIIPLGKAEQKMLEPFLNGKTAAAAVFSPRQAVAERTSEKRTNRKTKASPTQRQRDEKSVKKPQKFSEFYNKDSYRKAVKYAIDKANRKLPEGEKIPHWTPYQMRHTAATEQERLSGIEAAQVLLDHTTPNTTQRYIHGRLEKQKELARNRRNPFE